MNRIVKFTYLVYLSKITTRNFRELLNNAISAMEWKFSHRPDIYARPGELKKICKVVNE